MLYTVTLYSVRRIDTGEPLGILDAPMPTEPVRVEADDREEVERVVFDALAAHPEYTRASIVPVAP